MHTILRAALVVAALVGTVPAAVGNTGFDPRVITFGATREQLQNTPITQRPNRPLHVYGNSIRRRHERSSATRQPASRPRPAAPAR